jgi:raffinose/stachyose/melibiose transport system permease protein
MKKTHIGTVVLFTVLILVIIVYLSPLIMVVFGCFKTYSQIMTDALSLPTSFSLGNFENVIASMDYFRSFFNTLLISAVSVAGIVLISSLAGYKLSRTKTKYSRAVFLLCILPMMIPFQSFMITLVKVAKNFGFIGKPMGLCVIYLGLGAPLATFLYHGFVKGIPHEIEECAMLDGCTPMRLFFSVIFQILRPVTATVIVINAMWIWNDFLLPLLILGTENGNKTLQLAAYGFMGQYKMEWQNIMAGAVLIIIPAFIIYMIFQKNIVKGMISGAVKG